MAGPYPPEYGAGPMGPQTYPYPDNPPLTPPNAAQPYPGTLPPPVPYPKKRRWPLIAGTVIVLAVIAGLVAAIILVGRGGDDEASPGLTEAAAKTAIQDYLNAMLDGDDETVARHSLCGMFDVVKDKRSDLALAKVSAGTFRKQYASAEVTSIDKLVTWSPHQAQALFTMRVVPASRAGRDQQRGELERQAVAQLLSEGDEVLVCSYLPRTAGTF